MAKYPTFPTLYDDVLTLSMTKLIQWQYLKPDQIKNGVLTWSTNGRKTGSISIQVNTYSDSPYLELSYNHNSKPVKYTVDLISIPSNLGKGVVWYFLCPYTGKRCRKLYCVGEKFLHREAYTGCLYESQTYSHKVRNLYRLYDRVFGRSNLYDALHSKHFKRSYAGKPTKRFLKLMQQLQQARQTPYTETDLLLMR